MKKIHFYDESNVYIKTEYIHDDEQIPDGATARDMPEGLFKPTFENGRWVDGLSPEEINALYEQNNNANKEETSIENRLNGLSLNDDELGQSNTDSEVELITQKQKVTDLEISNMNQGQQATDLEILSMSQGQLITDLEIEITELKGMINNV
ncbi:hypothetical protein [Virgibacillus sp. Bac332]|uniref:hypothetical protein n=1 Tax=Virgibacillus sp. Bac332 TaxID=2419842 RepID=UPI000EF4936F|nr:hypothetical protein [Virgibacillus sp. Bac332]